MPDLVVWPESSLNIALLVNFKMAPFDQGKQNKYCVGWWLIYTILNVFIGGVDELMWYRSQ